jgi:hypothetical protein
MFIVNLPVQKRYITADSFHPRFQKNAAFHSMAHRLCNFNLSEEKYLKEKDTIVQIGQINGYQRKNIMKNRRRQELTTLIETRHPTKKRIFIPFFPAITNKLKKVFTRNNLEMVTTSGEYKLKNKQISTKDLKKNNHNNKGWTHMNRFFSTKPDLNV